MPYNSHSLVLVTNKEEIPYTFIVQYNNEEDSETANADSLVLTLDEPVTPEAFTVETFADGNLKEPITFKTKYEQVNLLKL